MAIAKYESDEDFHQCSIDVRARRPPSDPPLLVVLGNFEQFSCGPIFKSIRKTKLFSCLPFESASKSDLNRQDVAFVKWSPNSEYQITDSERKALPAGVRIINDTHFNCGKDNVQAAFERAAGYSSKLDPEKDTGLALVKSKRNARHDAEFVTLPDSTPRQDVVYERVIDNSIGQKSVYDIRIPYILGNVPFVYLKYRPREFRFTNINSHAELAMTGDILSPEEMAVCRRFCQEIGLEYGELDVLRDGASGKIYVVDANNTPVGPTKALQRRDRLTALRSYGVAFCRAVFNSPL